MKNADNSILHKAFFMKLTEILNLLFTEILFSKVFNTFVFSTQTYLQGANRKKLLTN